MPRKTGVAADTAAEIKEAQQEVKPDVEQVQAKPEKKVSYKVKKVDLPLTTMVTVKNGFNGQLVYKSRRHGERFVWDSFGAEQDLELQELKSAKNSDKMFFENNWFMIEDPEIIEYLGVERYYKNALKLEEFDTLFNLSIPEVLERIGKLSKGQKASVLYCAKRKIASREIDSIRMIEALEKCFGVDLIER